jgi:hypothetical protein
MLDAGEVRLRRIGEQVVMLAADLDQVARQQALIDAQIGCDAGDVARLGAAGAGELADPVDRVVIVEGEQEAVARTERVRLAHEAQGTRCVRGEDCHVLFWRGTEESEHGRARPLDQFGHRRRSRIE